MTELFLFSSPRFPFPSPAFPHQDRFQLLFSGYDAGYLLPFRSPLFPTQLFREQEYVQGRKEGWLQNDGNSVKYIAQHGPLSEAIL